MKVNKEYKEFHLSIKDIIFVFSERKFFNSPIPLRMRASKGTEIHQAFQKSRKKTEKNFQREVMVKFQIKVQEWKFIISGRADITYEKNGVLIIEEIKSISDFNEFNLESKTAEEYRLQLLLYGHYFLQLGQQIRCNLVLIDIFSEKTKIIEISPQDLSEYIQKQCKTILKSWKMTQKLKAERSKRAKTIEFPFDIYRPNQEEIIKKTGQLIQNEERLMLLAPSGLGKTIGTLFPALKYSLKNNLRIFVATSKTTQQHIYRETLQIFNKKKAKFNSIILTAKEKICLNNTFTCEKSSCPYLENYGKASLDKIVSEILIKQIIDARYIRKKARAHVVCPFEISLDCALFCDVIVGDYNYVFHPYIKLKRFFDQPHKDIILIVDEAHNLPSRAITYYSPEITLKSLNDVIYYLRSFSKSKSFEENCNAIIQEIMSYITNLINKFPDRLIKKPILQNFDKSFFKKVIKDFDQLILKYIQTYILHQEFQPPGKDKIMEFALNLRQFSKILRESDSPEYSELLYLKEGKIKIICKSAAPKLEKQIEGFHSVIMQSATLFPLDYFRKMVGYPPSARIMEYPSPFAQQNRLYLLKANVSTKYGNRREFYDQIASIICKSVNVKYGNYLAFFPSFAYLKSVQREIETNKLSVELLVQDRSMSEHKRKNYLKKLQTPEKKYLLLAVLGGIFSEGVDFTGDMAIGAFIIGPGLPAFSKEQELMQKYFDFKWKKGFDYAYRNPGMMKVIQAAGRIFRTSTDRGFVMLIGHRFSTPYYKCVLPTDWKIENPPDLIKRIQNFWMTQPADSMIKTRSMLSEPQIKIKKKHPNTTDLFDFMERI